MRRYIPKSNFTFGDVNLADYNNAFAFYCNVLDKPERDIEVVSVPGRNGDLLFDNGRYKNINRVYIVQVEGLDVAHKLMYDLLASVGYKRLTDEYDVDYYYMARLKSSPKIIGFVGEAVKLEITFDRMPQRWLVASADMVGEDDVDSSPYTGSVGFNVYNRTNYTSLPVLEIRTSNSAYETEDISIQARVDQIGDTRDNGVYGNVFLQNIKANQSIIIDNEKKAIYNTDTLENLSGKIYSTFRWMRIPTDQEGIRFKITIARSNSYSYHVKATLNTRMWEL